MFLFHIRIDSLLTAVASCAQVYKLFVGMFLFLVFSAVASYTQVFIFYTWAFPKVAVL